MHDQSKANHISNFKPLTIRKYLNVRPFSENYLIKKAAVSLYIPNGELQPFGQCVNQ